MNQTEIRVLQSIKESQDHSTRISDLAGKTKLSRRSVERATKMLKERGLVDIIDGIVSLSSGSKSALLNRLSNNIQIYKLLLDSGEKILPLLLEPKNVGELSESTNLSFPTTWRTLNRMKETGAIVQNAGKFSISDQYRDVKLLASILSEEGSGNLDTKQEGGNTLQKWKCVD